MKAIIKKPGEKPRVIEIENELSALQEAVDGYIQAVPLAADACIICNEEGETYRTSIQHKNPERDFCGEYSLCGSSGRRILQLDKRADQPDRRESFEQGGELNENPCCKEGV